MYILSIKVAKSIEQYSKTRCMLSFMGPTATSLGIKMEIVP